MVQLSSIEDSHLPNNVYYAYSHLPYLPLASSEKSTWLKNETSGRIFLRIQLQKWTRFRKSLSYKSWCNDIRYGWNLCWWKILNTDRWLIPLIFSICLLLLCGFSTAKANIAATLFSLTIGRRLTRVSFILPGVSVMFTEFPQHHQHIKMILKIVHFRVPMYSH